MSCIGSIKSIRINTKTISNFGNLCGEFCKSFPVKSLFPKLTVMRLAKEHVYAALDKAADNILSAAGDDPFVSRRDIRGKLGELSGIEKELTDIFYRFMDHRDHRPGARITKTDVVDTLAYAKEKLIDAYDRNNNGLSKKEIDQMSLTGKLAVRFGRMLKEAGKPDKIQLTAEILRILKELGDGLFFPAWANEADAFLKVFYQSAELSELTAENFADALGLDTSNPAEEVFFFQQGLDELRWILDRYQEWDQGKYGEQFQTLLDFMVSNLTDITHIIVGRDGLRSSSEYPVYFVGVAPDGDIVGFETTTVWT